ncbi:MAG: hypothetical protein BK997_03715 [Candidatus Micrarchaeum sp. ARMAN-1]|nr:MAG: hypothetical protein BK997_03715 [Candidatus Micrarchaeum sp. ARMAN-1]
MVTGAEEVAAYVLTNPKSVERAMKGVGKVVETGKKIEERLTGGLKVVTKLMEISCPQSTGVYQLMFRPKAGLINNTYHFKAGNILNATIFGVENFSKEPKAIKVDENGDAVIYLKELEQGALYSAKLTYSIENDDFLEDLVFTKRQLDTSNDEGVGKYWMTAGLKCPEVLSQQGFSRIDINNMNFSVDVNINNEINTAIPQGYKNQVELLSKLAGTRLGRGEWHQIQQELYRLKGEKYGDKELDLLSSMQELFLPNHFKRFVNVDGKFYYEDCRKGTNVYNLPVNIWPKFMTVISRTDLSLDSPVAQGALVYKKNEFVEEVKKKFK